MNNITEYFQTHKIWFHNYPIQPTDYLNTELIILHQALKLLYLEIKHQDVLFPSPNYFYSKVFTFYRIS